MWFIYALGGGWGHLTRAAALARVAPCPVRILTNSPYASLVAMNAAEIVAIDPNAEFDDAVRAVLREIEQARPSVLIVDTFARGLGGELINHLGTGKRVLVQRDVAPKYAAQVREFASSYDLILSPGEGTGFPGAIMTAPWLIRSRVNAMTREAVLVVAGGNADESAWYGEVAARLRRRRPGLTIQCVAPQLPAGCPPECWVCYWPAMDLIASARVVIGGAGYNTVHECAALNVPLVARPWPRKYDRQWLRARRAAACVKSVSEAVRAAMDLLDREPPPPSCQFKNGALEAAALIDRLASS
jgi:hypothetical protein